MSLLANLVKALGAASVLYLCQRLWRARRRLPYPPGPKPRAIIGNLLDIPRSRPCLTYSKWGREYGPLTYLSAAGKPMLIVNTYEAAVDLLTKRGSIYSDRPRFVMAGELMGFATGTAFMRFGPTWREHRALLKRALTADTVKRDYLATQERKAHILLKKLLYQPQNFLADVKRSVSESVTEIAYGVHANNEHDFVDMNEEISAISLRATKGYLVDILPWMKYIPSWLPGTQWKRDAKRWHDSYAHDRDYMFNHVRAQMTSGAPMNPSYVLNTLQEESANEDVIKSSAFSFYRAGADSSSGALKTIIFAMSIHPEIQATVQAELDSVFGDRLPSIDEYDKLPYFNAFLKECRRWAPPLTFVFHRLTQDDIYNDYFLAAGTTVTVNLWGLARNEKEYPEPNVFNPARFLNKEDAPMDPNQYIFGFGRRACPGDLLALQAIWITAASVIWSFNIKHKNPPPLPLNPEDYFDLDLTNHPLPFECEFTPRSEMVKERIAQVNLS